MRRFFSARETSASRSLNRQLAFQGAALLIIASLVIAVMSFLQLGQTPAARAASWNQIFDEEFNGPAGSGVNTNTWIYDTGTGWGTGEAARHRPGSNPAAGRLAMLSCTTLQATTHSRMST